MKRFSAKIAYFGKNILEENISSELEGASADCGVSMHSLKKNYNGFSITYLINEIMPFYYFDEFKKGKAIIKNMPFFPVFQETDKFFKKTIEEEYASSGKVYFNLVKQLIKKSNALIINPSPEVIINYELLMELFYDSNNYYTTSIIIDKNNHGIESLIIKDDLGSAIELIKDEFVEKYSLKQAS